MQEVLGDRLGWDSLTTTVEQVYAGLPPAQRAQACVVASNYGEASALIQLAAPGRLPPVISGHNNYYLWGPGACSGQALILVGFSPVDAKDTYADIVIAATRKCPYCVSFEQDLPIVVVSDPLIPIDLERLWTSVKKYD